MNRTLAKNKWVAIALTALLLLILVVVIKPVIDEIHLEQVKQVAVEVCGGIDNIKRVDSESIECL